MWNQKFLTTVSVQYISTHAVLQFIVYWQVVTNSHLLPI